MSSGSNNNPSNHSKAQVGLPLPPKRKSTTLVVAPKPPTGQQQQQQQQQYAFHPSMLGNNPFSPAGGLPQNPLLPANVAFAAGSPAHALAAFTNPSVLPNHHHSAAAMSAGAGTLSSNSNNCSSQCSPGTSVFFRGWKLRSGKWLEEEEAYAELLIDMFDRGQLPDCMTGSTLRAYLAQKLHCAPMRISKKFAGKGIGKKVYSCRIDNRKNVPASVAEQRRKLQEKAQDVEKAFQEAASCDAVGSSGIMWTRRENLKVF